MTKTKTIDINEVLARPFYKGYSNRGADMGRRDWIPADSEPCKLHLQQMRFVDDCYDAGGAYWGLPEDMWCAFSPDLQVMIFTRANSRTEAKRKVMEELDGQGDGWSFFR